MTAFVLCFICFLFFSLYITIRFSLVIAKNKDIQINRYKSNFLLLLKWDTLREKNVTWNYFVENEIQNIAIYGAGGLGKLLCDRSKEMHVNVAYLIDRLSNVDRYQGCSIRRGFVPEWKVDAIVVTPVWEYDTIVKKLREDGALCRIVSFEDVLNGIQTEDRGSNS